MRRPVETNVRYSLLGFILAKTVRDFCCVASTILQSIGKGIWSVGDTALAIESHFGQRYADLTDRELDEAMGQRGRHQMTPGPMEPMEGE